jgi:general secretion pathway protein J
MKTERSGRGFTLIEVLVAMSVMAIMAVMAWQGVDGIVRARDASQKHLEQWLRMNTVLAQWEQDLAAVQESQIVPALVCDGATVRLTRRTDKGLQVVAWALRPSTTHSTWWRWAAPPVTTVAELRANWARSQQLQGGEPEQLRTLEGLGSWLVYFYRGNAWSNCQSTAELRAVPGSAASAPLLQPPPDGVRMVLNFAPGSGQNGSITRDSVLKR